MGFRPSLERRNRIIRKLRYVLANKTGSVKTRVAAGALLMTACTLVSLQCNPMVANESVPGLVLEIDARGIQPAETDQPHSRVLIAVGDSTETHILLPPPVPLPGHFIPLKAAHYRKGNVEYSLDLEKWLLEGPS